MFCQKELLRKGSKRKSFPEGKDCSGEPGRLTGNKKRRRDSMRPNFLWFYFGLREKNPCTIFVDC
ncbi:hypothetical protein EHQ95_19115 [Leptospira vanthielii]|uniref:Uncharacterized protein n=1 Tax=Leptospira vanthielii TaxID=293085 RepID=A0ABY2NIR7_9LEPT|nr:hypothetical protein EHQ95_19115 [Leptospira vanthielii]